MDELVFTPSAVMGLLTSIQELKDVEISCEETAQGVTFSVGESTYNIDASSAEEVEVAEDIVEEVSDINEEGYQDLEESFDNAEIAEPVEGGLIKELFKTLALGGLVKLTKHALEKA